VEVDLFTNKGDRGERMDQPGTGSAEGGRETQRETEPPGVPGGTSDSGVKPGAPSASKPPVARIILRALATIGFIFGVLAFLSIRPGMNHSPAVAYMFLGLFVGGAGAVLASVAAFLEAVAIFGRRERSGVTTFFFMAELAYVLFALAWARSVGIL
jgi:hypothetical protein